MKRSIRRRSNTSTGCPIISSCSVVGSTITAPAMSCGCRARPAATSKAPNSIVPAADRSRARPRLAQVLLLRRLHRRNALQVENLLDRGDPLVDLVNPAVAADLRKSLAHRAHGGAD